MKNKYTKPVLSLEEQVDKVASKGFKIDSNDRKIFKDFLLSNGYYHISSYIKCFCKTIDGEDYTESDNVSCLDLMALYFQDRTLQYHLINTLLRVETFLKSTFIYAITQQYQDPFCHMNKDTITHRNRDNWLEYITKIQLENEASPIVKNYFEHYDEKYLTIWHLVEVSSFGSFTKLFNLLPHKVLEYFYDNLQVGGGESISNNKKRKILINWLKGITAMRNRIAHSEITWSIKALPKIKLPGIKKELNTIRSYIQLLIHLYECMFGKTEAMELKQFCYQRLEKIDMIPGLIESEKKRIGVYGKRK